MFGEKMVDDSGFHFYMKRSIEKEQVFVAYVDSCPAGIVSISKKHNSIAWFAVFREHQNRGIGTDLLRYALARLNRTRNVDVTTFRDGYAPGAAGRHVYAKCGFKEYDATIMHHGLLRAIMRLAAQSDERSPIT